MMLITPPRSELAPGIAGWQTGAGPDAVLIHGVGLNGDAWGPMVPHLAPHFRLTIIDMPGHGGSARLEGTPALADYAAAIAPVITRPSLVIGHSMGALIAIALAARIPDRVTGICPLNAVYRRDAAAKRAVLARAESLRSGVIGDQGPTLERWFGTDPQGADARSRDLCRDWLMRADPAGYGAAYTAFAQEDGPDDATLAAITCPALYVTGAEEPNSLPRMSEDLARKTARGQAQIIAGARHMMPMNHAAEVGGLVTAFHTTQILSERST